MKETKLLGTLLPSSDDLQPIIRQIRRKYNLAEIGPDDDPITEVYAGETQIPLEYFRKDIKAYVDRSPDFLPTEIAKIKPGLKILMDKPLDPRELRVIPQKLREALLQFYDLALLMLKPMATMLEQFNWDVADMLYIYILTGETQETPTDWISRVFTASAFGEPMVIAIASQVSNPETVVQQFRQEYAKQFGQYRPKITNTVMSTAYYKRLKREHKPWNYIVAEFIRLNHYSLPRDRNSKRYADDWMMYSERLRKRMKRLDTVLSVLGKDIPPDKNQPDSVHSH